MFWGESSEDKVFESGQEVVLHGLLAQPELNGKKGKCERWIEDSGQWSVRLDSGELKIVKPKNLQDVAAAEAAAAASAAVAQALNPTAGEGDGFSGTDVAFEAISAALQIFDLCSPAEDSTIAGADLERVLRTHLGREDDVKRIQALLREHQPDDDRYNFLSYWQGIDQYFNEAGAQPQHSGESEVLDTIRGMQKFRDGVLSIHHRDTSQAQIPATQLLNLLKEIKTKAEDPGYWDEVIQAIPDEEGFGLSMPEVAEAVYIWLKDFTGSQGGGDGDPVVGSEACACGNVFTDDSQFCNMCGAARSNQVVKESTQPLRFESGNSVTDSEARRASPKRIVRLSRSSLDTTPAGFIGVMQRAAELIELIGSRTPPDLTVVHQAVENLNEIHKSVEATIQNSLAEAAALQESLKASTEKREAIEVDLDRSQRHASEIDQRFGALERQRDEHLRRVGALEQQVSSFMEQRDALTAELRSVRAEAEAFHREKTNTRRKTLQIQDRMVKLEKDADTAEGQVSWLRNEVERLKSKLSACKQMIRSYAGCNQESDEVVNILQQRIQGAQSGPGDGSHNPEAANPGTADGTDMVPSQDLVELEKQLELHKAQLQRLRVVRDDLLKAHDSFGDRPDDGSCSPRELQVHRRCSFLSAQLQALLQHARNLECLLDDSSPAEPDQKRLMSVHRVAEDSKKAFGEFSEQLHTLEVQKEAVETEMRRLQTRFGEQENQLRAVQRHRDQLLVDAGALPIGKVDGFEMKVSLDEIRSNGSSGSPSKKSATADPTFLFGSAAAAKPADGQLTLSPKSDQMTKGVKAVVRAQQIAGADRWKRTTTSVKKSSALGFHVSVAPQGGNLAVPGTATKARAQAFDFSAPNTSTRRSHRPDNHAQEKDDSKAKDTKEEKATKKEKRQRRHREEDMFTKGVNDLRKEAEGMWGLWGGS